MTRLLLLCAFVFVNGCCTTGVIKKCCPPSAAPQLVEVSVPCKLPEIPQLPDALFTEKECPSAYVCFDLANAKILAERERLLKLWIREARTACTNAASQPASRATEK